ncbi:MAG: hypothetical protein Q4G59_08405 [Planctomycetia bacterium]|nr:hypothetical protein [Planctomycetia bacterium]
MKNFVHIDYESRFVYVPYFDLRDSSNNPFSCCDDVASDVLRCDRREQWQLFCPGKRTSGS